MPARCLDVTVGSTSALKENRFSAKQDPYAVIRLGDQEHRTTANAYERTRPVWNHRVSFLLHPEEEKAADEEELAIDIFEYGTAKDKHIGHCKIPLANVKEKGSVDVVQPVYRKSGKLLGHLRFHLAILEQQAAPSSVDSAQAHKDRNFHAKEAQEKLMRGRERMADLHSNERPFGLEGMIPAAGIGGWTPNGPEAISNNISNRIAAAGQGNRHAKPWQNLLATTGDHPGLEPFVQTDNNHHPGGVPTLLMPSLPSGEKAVSPEGGAGSKIDVNVNGLSLFPLKQDGAGGMVSVSSPLGIWPEKGFRSEDLRSVLSRGMPASFPFLTSGGGQGVVTMSTSPQHEPPEVRTSSPSAYVIPISYWQHMHPGGRQGFAPYLPDPKYDGSGPAASDLAEAMEQAQGQQQQQHGKLQSIKIDSAGIGNSDRRVTTAREGAGAWQPDGRSMPFVVGGKRKADSGNENGSKVVDFSNDRSQMPQLSSLVPRVSEGEMATRWQERVFFG